MPDAAGMPTVAARPVLPLRLEGVSYTVGTARLIDDVSLAIEAGPISVVLGPNGAGKSLLLRLCHGLIRPSAGRLLWQCPERAGRAQAMVFQKPVMLRRSAAANVAYALAIRGVRHTARRRRTAEALERTGLAPFAARPARALSGGEQQRLALARAWALEPEVLFLDEPTASLDPAATRMVEDIIRTIHAQGTKVVMTTHDLGQARRLAGDILFLHRGRLVERASADRFFAGPQSAEATDFIAGRLSW